MGAFLRLMVVVTSVLSLFLVWVGLDDASMQAERLREIYKQSPENWPKAWVVDSVKQWQELGPLPNSPYRNVDSLKAIQELGKLLFFDPRLSASDQISCSSCHDPVRNWTDNRQAALGHNHRLGDRNTPSISNIWAVEPLFWDGRATDLEHLVMDPIQDHREMNQEAEKLPEKLAEIAGYAPYFESAFGDTNIDLERISRAIAAFQRTIVSRKSDFDYFLEGREEALSDRAIRGLHLFRTKAKCINCHNGPLFTDNQFHNLGLHFYGRKREDLGRYNQTQQPEDVGRFKTPSLRDVAFTDPWMHNGLFDSLDGILNMYNNGMARPKPRPGLENDPLFPTTSELLVPLELSEEEKQDVIAFLHAISSRSFRMSRPELSGLE